MPGLWIRKCKKKLSDITKEKHCKYNKFKDEDRYTIGKYPTMEQLQPYKNSRNYFHIYRFTESLVKSKSEKYHRIVKSQSSSSPVNVLTLLKRGRPLLLGFLDRKCNKFLVALCSKESVVNTILAVAAAKAFIKTKLR